jgi:hypothetical protein
MTRSISVVAVAAALVAALPARAADREAIDKAVDKGAHYLQGLQSPMEGTWPHEEIGLTALCAVTLLECGVPTDDPGIQKAAAAVRSAAVRIDKTYSIALCIIFLDRLGEPVDAALIESLTVRLLAGQLRTGGWTYLCPKPPPTEERRLTGMLQQRGDRGPDKSAPPPEAGKPPERKAAKEILNQVERLRRAHPPLYGDEFGGDNSNTQFAVLGLWTARKYGLPVERALETTDSLFRRTTNPDGGWAYMSRGAPGALLPLPGAPVPPGSGSSPAMTCSGLLGIGLNYGAINEAALRTRSDDPDKPRPAGPKPRDPSQDSAVKNAFRLLGTWVDAMAHGDGKAPRINNASGKFYYFLWSLERVCVAYGVQKVGKTDWYDWGCDILLANQGGDGGWNNGEFRGGPDTCFALLVLRKADLVKGLNRALTSQMKGGLESTLRQGGVSGSDLVKGGGRKPFFDTPPPEETRDKPTTGPDADAARLGAQLASADGDKRERVLKELRDNKGAAYTEALAVAIPKLEGEVKEKAREALADRLSRMTSGTLEVKLSDDDAEIRRAAALAVAMKEDKAHAYRLIELLSDSETRVSRAAHAALKSLSGGEDFGPPRDATLEERGKAILAWKEWLRKQGEGKK